MLDQEGEFVNVGFILGAKSPGYLQVGCPNICHSVPHFCCSVGFFPAGRPSWPEIFSLRLVKVCPELILTAALGNMVVNAFGMSIAIGFSMGLDTLCTQAFGAQQYKLVGLYCQRAMVMLTIACIPIVILCSLTETILVAGNVDPDIAVLSQYWVNYQLIGLWPNLIYAAFQRYLLAQRIVIPQTIAVVISTSLHLMNSYLFVFVFDWGFLGAAVSTPITNWISLGGGALSYFLYRKYKKYRPDPIDSNTQEFQLSLLDESSSSSAAENEDPESPFQSPTKDVKSINEVHNEFLEHGGDPLDTWPALSWKIFSGWGIYLKLGIPAAFSLFIEWGSFEVNALIVAQSVNHNTTFVNGTLIANLTDADSVPLATHAILSNTASLWYRTFVSIASAATTLLGNALGAGQPEKASVIVMVGFAVTFIIAVTNGGLSMLYRYQWGRVYTTDQAVALLTARCMIPLWFYSVWDATKCIGIALLRGAGKYIHTVFINALSCIVIGWPLSWIIGVKFGLGVYGVWWGMSCAWLTASVCYVFILWRIDWYEESLESDKRTQEGLNSAS